MPTHFPTLNTQRFQLREIVPADLATVFRGLSHPKVIKYYNISYDSLEATQAQMDWFQDLFKTQEGIWWGIFSAEKPAVLMGACGIYDWQHPHRCAELGYWLLPEYWQQGVMHECLSAIVPYCFTQLKLHRIEAFIESENDSSWRLLEKIGFELEGIRKECEFKEGRYLDLKCYATLAK